MILISIIVPAYNAEKTIRRCIESVLNQDYSNYELIIVNDGSTDRTDIICKYYIRKAPQIQYIYQKNSGEGPARNTGLKHMKGDYVVFLDSDDSLPSNALSLYINEYINDKQYDVIVGGSRKYTSEKVHLFMPEKEQEYDNHSIKKAIFDSKIKHHLNGIQSKIFNTAVIRDNNIRFKNKVYGADTDFLYQIYSKSNKIKIVRKVLYDVFVTPDSASLRIIDMPWNEMVELYESGIANFKLNQSSKIAYLLLMRSIKTSLLLETRKSKTDFLKTAKIIRSYLCKNGLNQFSYHVPIYDFIIYNLVKNTKVHFLYLIVNGRNRWLK